MARVAAGGAAVPGTWPGVGGQGQTDRHAARYTDTVVQTDRQADRQTIIQTYRHAKIQKLQDEQTDTDKQTERQANSHATRVAGRKPDRETAQRD